MQKGDEIFSVLSSIFRESGAVAQFGRARDWQSRGRGFDPHQLHQLRSRQDPCITRLTLPLGSFTDFVLQKFASETNRDA